MVGDAGVLVDPDDVDGWCQAITGLLDAPDERARLAALGRVRAQRYSWAANAAAFTDLYRAALRERRAGEWVWAGSSCRVGDPMGKASSPRRWPARPVPAAGSPPVSPAACCSPACSSLVIVLGVSLVVYARNDRRKEDLGGTPQLGDHIHQAFGINVCGEWLENVPEFESAVGIHTHGDGVLHIHPFSQLGVGANATLGRFLAGRPRGRRRRHLGQRLEAQATSARRYKEGDDECEGVDDPAAAHGLLGGRAGRHARCPR